MPASASLLRLVSRFLSIHPVCTVSSSTKGLTIISHRQANNNNSHACSSAMSMDVPTTSETTISPHLFLSAPRGRVSISCGSRSQPLSSHEMTKAPIDFRFVFFRREIVSPWSVRLSVSTWWPPSRVPSPRLLCCLITMSP